MAASASTANAPGGAVQWTSAVRRMRRPRPAPVLLGALLVAITYAAFAAGATGVADESRVQIGLAGLAVLTAACALWGSSLRATAPALAWGGVASLALFAAWSGITLAWSVAPGQTWIELNRAIAYTLVVALSIVAAASYPRARKRFAEGYLAVAVLVGLYALGGKVAPGFHIAGLFNLDQTDQFSRLRAPLQYWNALGIFCVMAVPLGLRIVTDSDRERRPRLASLVGLEILLVTIGLTYSRGAIVSLIAGLIAGLWLSRARLRSLLYLGMALLAAAPGIAYAFGSSSLTTNGVALHHRETAGAALGAVLVASLAVLLAAGAVVVRAERRTAPDPARSRRIGLALAGVLGVLVLIGAGVMTISDRGFFGTISHQVDEFTSTRTSNQFDPARLLKTNSGNRWVWWKEAVGAWSARPLRGWGAGSFEVLHRQYRKNTLQVSQPHNVPLQFLAETGLVGCLLAMGGLLALLAAGLAGLRRLAPGRDRELGAMLFAAAFAYLIHGLYDWDWDIPGVTLPALVLLGLLATPTPEADPSMDPVSSSRVARGRVLILLGATLIACTVVLSARLPAWSDAKTTAALDSIPDTPTDTQLHAAEKEAKLASRLNPLDVSSLQAAAIIAERRGHLEDSRDYLIEAVRRQPNSNSVWIDLARLEAKLGDIAGIRLATERALAVDPESASAQLLASSAIAQEAPANDSATATGTPLPSLVASDTSSSSGAETETTTTAAGTTGALPPWLYGAASQSGAEESGTSFAPGSK
jgi:tetratricopeptide (TPR) repeat protein